MPHKADESFFDRKRPWSKRKDHILAYYLEPYLAKVARLGRPILIVDGFAGPGRFADGDDGSPLIICEKAQAAIERGAQIAVFCIEADESLCAHLRENLTPFPFAEPKHGRFLDHVPEIRRRCQTHTVFLYVDPFTVEGLDWDELDSVFRQVRESGASVEVLMNFNAASFVRRALAVLGREIPGVDPDSEDPEESDAPVVESPTAERLSAIVGGTWWQDVLRQHPTFLGQVRGLAERFRQQLRTCFDETGSLGLKAKATHRIPKYYLIFGSRHVDGLELMNDAMVKTRGASLFCVDLFARQDLENVILQIGEQWMSRGDLIHEVMRRAFCMFSWAEIRGCIQDLLREARLISETAKARINDRTLVKRA